jgi:hypothetical protein
MKISMLTHGSPDPAFWVPNDYAVVIVDQRGALSLKENRRLLHRAGMTCFT